MVLATYSKLVAALTAALAIAGTAAADGSVVASEWVQIILAFVGALGVFALPNAPSKQQVEDFLNLVNEVRQKAHAKGIAVATERIAKVRQRPLRTGDE